MTTQKWGRMNSQDTPLGRRLRAHTETWGNSSAGPENCTALVSPFMGIHLSHGHPRVPREPLMGVRLTHVSPLMGVRLFHLSPSRASACPCEPLTSLPNRHALEPTQTSA